MESEDNGFSKEEISKAREPAVHIQAKARIFGLSLQSPCQRLRRSGLAVELGYSGNLGKRMKRANKVNARAAVILGEDELARQVATVRDMDSGEQVEVPLDKVADHLARYRGPGDG